MSKNLFWIIPSAIGILGSIGLWFIDPHLAVTLSVYTGIIFLGLCLLPINVFTFLPTNLKKITMQLMHYRREFGITAGLLFLTHGTLEFVKAGLNPRFLLLPPIVLGVITSSIFEVMLLTSNRRALMLLKRNWKNVHNLVWFALPFALFHSMLANLSFNDEISKGGLLGFGGLIVFVIFETIGHYIKHKNDPAKEAFNLRHSKLVAAGFAFALLFTLLFHS